MSGRAWPRRIVPWAWLWLASPLARLAGLLLLLFLWPWRAVGRGYGHLVTGVARLFLDAGPAVTLRYPQGDNPWRLRIVADELATGRFVETALDLRRAGFIASAVFVALVLATPIRWRRRAHAFHLGAVARAIAGIAYHVLVTAPVMAFAFPGLLWLLLMWRFEPTWLRALLLRVTHGQHADGIRNARPAVAQHRGDRALAGRP